MSGNGSSSKKHCVLFRDEDYLPPTKEEDITGVETLEEIEMVMRTTCPRCGKVKTQLDMLSSSIDYPISTCDNGGY